MRRNILNMLHNPAHGEGGNSCWPVNQVRAPERQLSLTHQEWQLQSLVVEIRQILNNSDISGSHTVLGHPLCQMQLCFSCHKRRKLLPGLRRSGMESLSR